jgi:hypothetical protein
MMLVSWIVQNAVGKNDGDRALVQAMAGLEHWKSCISIEECIKSLFCMKISLSGQKSETFCLQKISVNKHQIEIHVKEAHDDHECWE